jgi:hypothetical protein
MSFLVGFAPQLLGMGVSGLAEGGLLSGMGGMSGTLGSMTSMLFPFGNPFSGQQQQQQSQGMSITTIAIIGVGGIVVLTLLIK